MARQKRNRRQRFILNEDQLGSKRVDVYERELSCYLVHRRRAPARKRPSTVGTISGAAKHSSHLPLHTFLLDF